MSTNNSLSVLSNVLWKFAERIAAQLVSLIVSIVLARILLPDDYGVISMVTVFITIANVFVTSGIPNALIQKKDADQKDFSSVFYFNILMSIVIYIVLFFIAPYIARFYNMDLLCAVVRVMGLRIIIAGINSVQHSYVSRNMMFRKYFWSTLFGTLCSGVVGIAMAYQGFGVWALVAQYMVNSTVDTIVLFITVEWRPILYFSFERIKTMLNFGWKILVEGLSNTVMDQLRSLVIGKVYSPSDLGYYSKGQQFPSLIVTNISTSISSVLFPAMSKEQDNHQKIVEMLRNAVRVSSFVIFPLLTGLAVVAPTFVSVVLTDKWNAVVPYIQIFCLINAFTVGMIPRHQALNSIGRSDVFMYEHIIGRIVNILLLLCFYKKSVMAIAVSGLAGATILLGIIFYTSKRYSGYSYADQVKDVLPIMIGCLIMGAPVYLMNNLNMPKYLLLGLQIICGGIIYIAYSIITKSTELLVLCGFVKSIIERKGKKR